MIAIMDSLCVVGDLINNNNNNRFIATTIIMTMLTIIEHTDFIMDFGLHFHLNPTSLKLHVKFPLVHNTSGNMYYCMG